MKMDEQLDNGDTFGAVKTSITADETAETLHDRLAALAAVALPDALISYLEGHAHLVPQDHANATFTKMLSREDGRIDWNDPSIKIERMIRAFYPWPACYAELDGMRTKILQSRVDGFTILPAGTWSTHNGLPAVTFGDGRAIILERVQPEGRPAMDGSAFLRGRRSSIPSTSGTADRADDSHTA